MPTTINHNRGVVVLLPFPFSDQSAAKLRPAVVANPIFPSDDLIVVALSGSQACRLVDASTTKLLKPNLVAPRTDCG